MLKLKSGLFFSPDDGGGSGSDGGGENNQQQNDGNGDKKGDGLRWDTWHKDQPEEIQTLITEHESSLKTALETERDARKKAEKQLRDMASKLEDESETKAELLKMADDHAAMNQKAQFYEDAHEAGVTNLKLAYLAAQNDDLFDRKGVVDFDAMKENYPQLFAKQNIPNGGAGDGTGDGMQHSGPSMNSFIRQAAGRK